MVVIYKSYIFKGTYPCKWRFPWFLASFNRLFNKKCFKKRPSWFLAPVNRAKQPCCGFWKISQKKKSFTSIATSRLRICKACPRSGGRWPSAGPVATIAKGRRWAPGGRSSVHGECPDRRKKHTWMLSGNWRTRWPLIRGHLMTGFGHRFPAMATGRNNLKISGRATQYSCLKNLVFGFVLYCPDNFFVLFISLIMFCRIPPERPINMLRPQNIDTQGRSWYKWWP